MRHTFFEIWNFKGIAHARLDFDSKPKGNIYTLVGLNESGKTTVLEALNFFSYKVETLDPLNLAGYSITDVHQLIPMSKRSNFNEEIVIRAGFEADAEDNRKIADFLLRNHGYKLTEPITSFYISQRYKFTDSVVNPGQPRNLWNIDLIGKKKGARLHKDLSADDPEWQAVVKYIQTLLPSVLFFPNFFFEFPDPIYLENPPSEPKKHDLYRLVLQDVLDSIGINADLDKHVLSRAKSASRSDRQALESLLGKMGGNISATVMKQWNEIFKRNMGRKEILVMCDKDDEGNVFLELRLRDGDEQYAISERSVGFKWFFAFLLLTQYRGFRKDATRNVLFLLDEPASNLHPSAQAQLLKSFSWFPKTCSIVYATHSHHMINPDWLENTFVVKNDGLVYDSSSDDYSASKTVITLEKYREFASKHPNQRTYYQPVLDVLDYCPSALENVPSVVMVEGKNDYYTLRYLQEKVLKLRPLCNLMPGGGSGSLDTAIRLYLAWGRDFVVLLDSDKAGAREKKRYNELFGRLVEDRIYTLADIDPSWQGSALEDILAPADRELIQRTTYPIKGKFAFSKDQFNRSVQELYLTDKALTLTKESCDNFGKIFGFFEGKLPST